MADTDPTVARLPPPERAAELQPIRFVTPSWIVDNDPGDEDPSVVPERRAVIEINLGAEAGC